MKIIEYSEMDGITSVRIDHLTWLQYMSYLDSLHDLYDKGIIWYLATRQRNKVIVQIRY